MRPHVAGGAFLLILSACATAIAPPGGVSTHAASATSTKVSRERQRLAVSRLVMLAAGSTASEKQIDTILDGFHDKASLDATVASLLSEPRFAREVAPFLIASTAYGLQKGKGFHAANTLMPVPGSSVLTMPERTCAPSDVAEVSPWWAPNESVKVCTNSYRPDVFYSAAGPKSPHCSGAIGYFQNGQSLGECGCGPFLIRCIPDAAKRQRYEASVLGEVVGTIAHVVEHDLPLETIFTANETFRTAEAEAVIRRDAVERGEKVSGADLFDVSAWPRGGAYRRRPENYPGEHAGILTTPQLRWSQDGQRGVLKFIYDILWCSPQASVGVDVKAILGIGDGNLRSGAGWQTLARLPGCTDCHARLDYSVQAFKSYSDAGFAFHSGFKDRLPGRGPMFADNIEDPRGDAELTPKGFAEWAVKQPEFARCMVTDVTRYVYGAQVPPAAVTAQIRRELETKHSFRAMMQVALVSAISEQLTPSNDRPAPDAALPRAARTRKATPVALEEFRNFVDEHCAACHSSGDQHDFTERELTPRNMAQMVGAVGFGAMPKGSPMPHEERAKFVRLYGVAMGFTPENMERAEAYFVDHHRPDRAPVFDIALHALGVDQSAWKITGLDRFIDPSLSVQSPGYAAELGFAALEACRKEGTPTRECLAAKLQSTTVLGH